MKLVTAIIRPDRFSFVQKALIECGIDQYTVMSVTGRGHEPSHSLFYRSTVYHPMTHERVRIEIAVRDEVASGVVETIKLVARTGEVGDGIIMVTPLESFNRIRTGEGANGPENRLGRPRVCPTSNGTQLMPDTGGRRLTAMARQ